MLLTYQIIFTRFRSGLIPALMQASMYAPPETAYAKSLWFFEIFIVFAPVLNEDDDDDDNDDNDDGNDDDGDDDDVDDDDDDFMSSLLPPICETRELFFLDFILGAIVCVCVCVLDYGPR